MRLAVLMLCILIPSLSFCQNANDSFHFGNISKTELEMTECDFDKNAEAVVLFDVEEIKCSIFTFAANAEIIRHVRIKILKDKGMEAANIKIIYFSYKKIETVKNIVAQTYNLDRSGNLVISKLEKKNIFDKEVSKNISQKIFSFPEVKKGSILEYSYTIASTLDLGLRDWEFQTTIPVKFSRVSITAPYSLNLSMVPVCTMPVSKEKLEFHGDNVNRFIMVNIPAIREEGFMSSEKDYVQRLEINIISIFAGVKFIVLRNTWSSLINELQGSEDFGEQLTKHIPLTDTLQQLMDRVDSSYKKMADIFYYVRNHMDWNGNDGIWAQNGVLTAWSNKKGNIGDINLILINLLRAAGVRANPILVSSHENGVINQVTPAYEQFDKVMAYIKINQQIYVLDASDKYASPYIVPWDVMFTYGILIEKEGLNEWKWCSLWNENQIFNNVVVLNADIDQEGNMKGVSMVYSLGYARSRRFRVLKSGKEKFIEKYCTSANPEIKVDSVTFKNEAIDSLPMEHHIFFVQNLSSTGDYKFFKTNPFTGYETNPFTSDTRFSDIFFGANQKFTQVVNINLPEGYELESLPKNTTMIMPDTSIIFRRIVQGGDGKFSMRTTFEFKKP
ncbi:MAG TPA: DUF3857 and transglutaminase domain-containing protein, partial [Puia sp.]|nr:DUF3857 and transglutaminase domain-containing protein [Puia sp.]